MQAQFIAHSLNSDTVNPFDQAIEQVVHEEGLPVIVTPEFVPECVNVFLDTTLKKAPAPGSTALFR